MLSKIKNFCKQNEKDLILAAVIVMVALIGFGLGRLSKIREQKTPITIENIGACTAGTVVQNQSAEGAKDNDGGAIVASKNGTKYHYPWCPGAQSIKEENKIWFASIEEAQKAGYTPASNCKGLK